MSLAYYCQYACSFHILNTLLNLAVTLAGLFDVSLNLLDAWTQQHAVSQAPTEAPAANIQEVPRWVDALLLCLDMAMQPQPAAQSQPEQPAAGASTSAPSASEAPASSAGAAPSAAAAPAAAPSATPAADAATGSSSQAKAAEGDQAATAPSAGEKKEEAPVVKSVEERHQAATQMLRDNIKTMFLPNGLLSQQQLDRAATICMKLLQHLHAWGSAWEVPSGELTESEAFARPQPASSTQAVIQVLARVTKSHKVALKVSACGQSKQPLLPIQRI